MAKSVFGNLPTSIPKSDPRIVRVDFEKQDMGARKSHVPTLPKNNQPIVHVGRGS